MKKNHKGLSLIALIFLTAIVSLILRFSIVEFINSTIDQNELTAQSTLKLISTALENYAKDHQGFFPTELAALSRTVPPYLDKNFNLVLSSKGYSFACPRLEVSGYNCFASPIKCNITGKSIYDINTGGTIVSEECKKKE